MGASGPFSCPVVTTDPSVFPARAPAAPSRPPRAVARAPVPLNARPVSRDPRHEYPLARHHSPGLPGPVARAVGTSTTQPPRKSLSLLTHLAWDVLPGVAPEVVGAGGWRGKVPVRCVRRGGIGRTKRVHKRVFPTEGGRSRLCVWFPDPAMTPPARLPQEDPPRGRRPLSRPYVGWAPGGGRAEEENE